MAPKTSKPSQAINVHSTAAVRRPTALYEPQPLDGYGSRLARPEAIFDMAASCRQPQPRPSSNLQPSGTHQDYLPIPCPSIERSSAESTSADVSQGTSGLTPMERFLFESRQEQPWNAVRGITIEGGQAQGSAGRRRCGGEHEHRDEWRREDGKSEGNRSGGKSIRARKGSESS